VKAEQIAELRKLMRDWKASGSLRAADITSILNAAPELLDAAERDAAHAKTINSFLGVNCGEPGMDCDSYGHDEKCDYGNPNNAWNRLTAKIAYLEAALAKERERAKRAHRVLAVVEKVGAYGLHTEATYLSGGGMTLWVVKFLRELDAALAADAEKGE